MTKKYDTTKQAKFNRIEEKMNSGLAEFNRIDSRGYEMCTYPGIYSFKCPTCKIKFKREIRRSRKKPLFCSNECKRNTKSLKNNIDSIDNKGKGRSLKNNIDSIDKIDPSLEERIVPVKKYVRIWSIIMCSVFILVQAYNRGFSSMPAIILYGALFLLTLL